MKKVEDRLFEMQDLKFRDFNAKLMPTVSKDLVIGVRTPDLRKYAKEFAKDLQMEEFLREVPHKYFEENNLHGFIIEYLKEDFDQTLKRTEEFLPYIDNWATCDIFLPKALKENPQKFYEKTLEWLESDHIYTVRYAVVAQLTYFLEEYFNEEMLKVIEEIHSNEYYINMAIAWYFSFALILQYDQTISIFKEERLDKWVHNKALQKAIESYRFDKETKDYFRSLKIK